MSDDDSERSNSSDEEEAPKLKKVQKKLKKSEAANKELQEENKALEVDLEKVRKKLEKKTKKCQELEEELSQLREELDSIKEEATKREESKKSKSKAKKAAIPICSEYDIVVKVTSLVQASNGWEVKFKDKKSVEEKFKKPQIALGVMGRENVGKTYIINKICGENFASGYFTNTEGLSIKYCDEDTKQLKVLMDSAGMNSAIFFYNYEEAKIYFQGKEKEISKEEYEKMKELMINDRSMTEYFIQNFILDSCNVILIVVELLSQNDQKMIERIKHLYSAKKTIIIIHNYFKLESKEQALDRAEYEISGAFRTIPQNIPNSKVSFYIERSQESKTKKNIVHLIIGKEGSESGNFFNEASFQHLMKFIEAETDVSEFDLLDKLNTYWKQKHLIYFQNFTDSELPEFKLVPMAIKEKSEKLKEKKKIKETWTYKLDTAQELTLKCPEFSVLGTMKELDLTYHMYVNNQSKLREKIYYFEMPGCREKPAMSLKKFPKENQQIMTLDIKPSVMVPENCHAEIGGLTVGNFKKKLKINDEFGEYNCDKEFTKLKNGILQMKFVQNEDEDLN